MVPLGYHLEGFFLPHVPHVPHVGDTVCHTFKFFSANSATRVELKTSNISALHHHHHPTTTALAVVFEYVEDFRCGTCGTVEPVEFTGVATRVATCGNTCGDVWQHVWRFLLWQHVALPEAGLSVPNLNPTEQPHYPGNTLRIPVCEVFRFHAQRPGQDLLV